MSKRDEIMNAIGAHGKWKMRLKSAISTGVSDFDPEKVKTDNNCEFGKWLHSLNSEKTTTEWKNIKALHEEFHQEAGHILESALKGDKENAEAAIGTGKPFATISSKLTSAMLNWAQE